jgi:hypothetical protein
MHPARFLPGLVFAGLVTLASACGPKPAATPSGDGTVLRTETGEQGLITCSDQTADHTCYTHRAIIGVSMGSNGAGMLGFLHPELFDAVGMLGVPFVDWVYFIRNLRRSYGGGFCSLDALTTTAAIARMNDPSGPANCGPVPGVVKLLPGQSTLLEASQDFNHWYRGADAGRGGNFGRNKLRQSMQDIALALGNPLYYNPDSPYLPRGVPPSYLMRSDADRCQNPVVLHGVKHKEYNPDGKYDVLAICDTSTDLGDFDPAHPADAAAIVLLAVDLNGNGRRDYGEPILDFASERYQDVGTGPDDAYDWDTNPAGKAGNWIHDDGEPFDDYGLDGIPNTGDYGEGNGKFDYNPNLLNFFAQNPRTLIETMPEGQLSRLNIWADAGIRDFLMSAGGTNWLWGALRNRVGRTLARDYVDFPSLPAPGAGKSYDYLAVDYSPGAIGQHAYLRYGDPNASQAKIDSGDGNHVGTAGQVIDRFLTALTFIQSRFYGPAADRRAITEQIDTTTLIQPKTYHSKAIGADRPFGIALPPGYDDPANANERYPVLYFLHGQGMESTDLLDTAVLFFGYMAGSTRTDTVRRNQSDWAKFIIVFPDSHCYPGDDCSTGNFNTNHRGVDGNGPKYQDALYELMAYVEANYRTAIPVEVPR